uniref:Uncharacterized protein n=1 Tax=Solanum tuberosum TaxID=4113 RepID=M1DRU3_SOLTU
MEKILAFRNLVLVPTEPPTDRRWGSIVKVQNFMVSDPTHGRPVQSVVGPTDHRPVAPVNAPAEESAAKGRDRGRGSGRARGRG